MRGVGFADTLSEHQDSATEVVTVMQGFAYTLAADYTHHVVYRANDNFENMNKKYFHADVLISSSVRVEHFLMSKLFYF